jgi:formylglycine-generating enzyme required for sulfatase activity
VRRFGQSSLCVLNSNSLMTTSTSHFTDHQKSALVQLIITGGLSLQQACSQYGLSTDQLKEWVCLFRRAVRQALDHQLRDTLSLQGLDLELWRAEFSGDLADMGVADLLQTIHMGRKDARITVAHGGEASEIWCRAGRVVDAQSGTLTGEAAFYRILAVEQGSVIADFSPNERARRVQLSTPRLLLKAASSTGMRARLLHRIGNPGQVFRVATDVTARQAARFEADDLDVLSLFDGMRSLEEVLLLSGLPDARALELVARFREQNVIVPLEAGSTLETSPDSPAPSSNITMSYRPFVASMAPEPVRLPPWLLACGAVLCSSLGAVSAIIYANTSAFAPSPGPVAPAPAATSASAWPAAAAPLEAPRCVAPMLWIEGGSFTMGSDSKRPALSLARPPHRVTLGGFCMDPHEVTVGEYRACSDAGNCAPAHRTAHFAEASEAGEAAAAGSQNGSLCNGGKPGREQHPINCVSHTQAAEYCRGRGGRLPTEAEWEFAARGNSSRAFPWGDEKPTRSHVNACGQECERWHALLGAKSSEPSGSAYAGDDGYAGTSPIGAFPNGKNPEGIQDLIGNVFEWTAGGLYTYDRAPTSDPKGPSDSESFVIRGGNFNSTLREFLDPALRFAMHRESYSPGVGFRCAADASSDEATRDPSSLAGAAPTQNALPASSR